MKWISRFFVSFLFAIPLMLITFVAAQGANTPQRTSLQGTSGEKLDCTSCHEAFKEAWSNGAHGHAGNDPAFLKSWEFQGKPAECMACHATGYDPTTKTWQKEGIACEVCHSPEIAVHPLAPMSMDRSAELCGKCHTDATLQWKTSKHSVKGVDCVACHDPHATGLKIADVNELCATCHQEMVNDFAHSQHNARGLTCASCHLTENSSPLSNGATLINHTFSVDLNTCNNCHMNQLHTGPMVEPHATGTPDAMAAITSGPISKAPSPISPIGFTALAGLIGIGLGIVLTPWFERLYLLIHPFGNR